MRATSTLTLLAALWLCVTLLCITGCDDALVEPAPFNYPIQLEVRNNGSAAALSWTEATVSTFEEYIILRSPDSIADTPEPLVEGQTVILERIDRIDGTSYEDFSFPPTSIQYYKVYAKIGDRFLYSATQRIELDPHLINFRTDNVVIDTSRNQLIAHDRSSRVLYLYDYERREILADKFISQTNVIMKFGDYNGDQELYVSDRFATTNIYDWETLDQKALLSVNFGDHNDFAYRDGYFYFAENNTFGDEISIYSRQTLNAVGGAAGNEVPFRFLTILNDTPNNKLYEFSSTGVSRYLINGSDLFLEKSESILTGSALLSPMVNPQQTEMVGTASGIVINTELEAVANLGSGGLFISRGTYSTDGRFFVSSRFNINQNILEFFDRSEGYKRVRTIEVDINPTAMFADGNSIYLLGVVFFNGATRTLIREFELPE